MSAGRGIWEFERLRFLRGERVTGRFSRVPAASAYACVAAARLDLLIGWSFASPLSRGVLFRPFGLGDNSVVSDEGGARC